MLACGSLLDPGIIILQWEDCHCCRTGYTSFFSLNTSSIDCVNWKDDGETSFPMFASEIGHGIVGMQGSEHEQQMNDERFYRVPNIN